MFGTIRWIIGDRSQVASNAPLEAGGGLMEIASPDYGYVRGSLLLHDSIGYDLCNDWVSGNLGELTYTDRRMGTGHGAAFVSR